MTEPRLLEGTSSICSNCSDLSRGIRSSLGEQPVQATCNPAPLYLRTTHYIYYNLGKQPSVPWAEPDRTLDKHPPAKFLYSAESRSALTRGRGVPPRTMSSYHEIGFQDSGDSACKRKPERDWCGMRGWLRMAVPMEWGKVTVSVFVSLPPSLMTHKD